jgi:hypothetical protein
MFCVTFLRMISDDDGVHPMLCWEIQGSAMFERRVRELGYLPYYVRRDEDALGKPMNNAGRAGVNQAPAVIQAIMESYRDALYHERCINPSEYALSECPKFVYTNTGVEYLGRKRPTKQADEGSGARVHHGDVVKADALAWKMVKEEVEKERAPKPIEPEADPRTFAGRMKMHQEAREEEEVWI